MASHEVKLLDPELASYLRIQQFYFVTCTNAAPYRPY